LARPGDPRAQAALGEIPGEIHMKRTNLRTLVLALASVLAACSSIGCSAADTDESYEEWEETSQSGQVQQKMNTGWPSREVFDCNRDDHKACYECGNEDGVICCVADCIVINQPLQVGEPSIGADSVEAKAIQVDSD
jgi:hypothetical protein